MNYFNREIEPVLKSAVNQFRVLVLTGARQTGKSTLLQHLFNQTHQYVTLDNPRALTLAQNDPEFFIEQYKPPVIIDEIQYAPGLLPYIKIQVDREQKRGMYLLTGSQQFTMMKNSQETLAGRAAIFNLLPLSVFEGPSQSKTFLSRGFKGSYPELLTIKDHDPQRWYESYLTTYIEKDVQPHYRLEKVSHFRDLLFLLATRVGQILNYNSLSNDLGVSITAIKLWLRILEASQIIYLLKPYYINLGSRIIKSPKLYFLDIGFLNYLLGNREEEFLYRGAYSGNIFENFVIQEVLKKLFNSGKTPSIFYYRTNSGLEVDLILEAKAGILQPCEIKLTKTPHPDMLNSIKRLHHLNQNKKVTLEKGSLICLAKEKVLLSRYGNAIPLPEFLQSL